MPRRIEDYALVGDTQTVALVSKTGCIDWLCFPRFDSDACFAALLGDDDHGTWKLLPRGKLKASRRRYRDRTLVLETELETADGVVRIVDFMPPRGSTPDLVRVVEGVRGTVTMQMLLRVRFGYGRMKPWLRQANGALIAVSGPDAIALYTPVEVTEDDRHADLVAAFTVGPKDRIPFVLTWSQSHAPLPEPVDGLAAVEDTERWWRDWMSNCEYEGPWQDAVERSLIALKALTYLPTGGIIAAATTSLPEQVGGVRNWDYRYCWLRDATFTLYALLGAGFEAEAHAWRDWLLRAVAGDPAQLQIMYGAAGERRLTELELPWLPGFEGSAPVRIGNEAVEQFQLDIYGEVIDVLHQSRLSGIEENPTAWALQKVLVHYVEKHWQQKDRSIWEVRGRERHFTHSKMMAWVALDRVICAAEQFNLEGDLRKWKALRARIHRDVLENGFNSRVGAFTQFYGSKQVDAALLLMPLVGFLPATDPRVRGTVAAIERDLMEDGFIRRYLNRKKVENLPGEEGVFLACTCWFADNLFLLGREDEAKEIFERVLSVRNDVGLLSEQYDVRRKQLLGNFPQAFSHVSVVNTARLLTGGTPHTIERHGNNGGAQ